MLSVKGGVVVVEYLKKSKGEELVATFPRLEKPQLQELRL